MYDRLGGYRMMSVIVVGCGRLGAELAGRLSQQGHKVTIVDLVAAAFDNLPAGFHGRTVEGEVLHQDVLRRAGVESADALAAVTNSDLINAVAAHVARTVYQVPQVVARNYDPRWRPLHEAFGLQFVSSTTWGAERIEELFSLTGLHRVWSSADGAVEMYELVVPDTADGHRVGELCPGGECIVVALTRNGHAEAPAQETCLEKGDVIYLTVTPAGREALRRRWASWQGA
jgi:trk system potassium uptake protein